MTRLPRIVVAAAVLLAALALVSCEAGGGGEKTAKHGTAGWALSEGWVAVSAPGHFLTTPRWSPGGDRLLVSGLRGAGLYVFDAGSGSLQALSQDYRGPAAWLPGGLQVCLFDAELRAELLVDTETGARTSSPEVSCGFVQSPLAPGKLLYADGRRAVWHGDYGKVLAGPPGGALETIEESGAWSVQVAPGGGRIAWCTGTLLEPSLFVFEEGKGKRAVGRGAHPAWAPDGRLLVYSDPRFAASPDASGLTRLVSSDLRLFDVERGTSSPLAETPQLFEMEPAVSPSGGEVAFTDWESGILHVARLARGEAR